MSKKLSPAQTKMLALASKSKNKRVYAIDFVGFGGRSNTVRQSAFHRTCDSLVRAGKLRRVYDYKGWLVSGVFELVAEPVAASTQQQNPA